MENNTEDKVKDLVTDFKLDEALDLLIAQAQNQNQRKQNTLLVLKGKLAMLEEQGLAGMLAADELARQKAAIAHQILDIADGSPLDHELPQPKPEQVTVQKTVSVPTEAGCMGKNLIIGSLLLAAVLLGVFIAKNTGEDSTQQTEQTKPVEGEKQPGEAEIPQPADNEAQPSTPTEGQLLVHDFPNFRKKFNFLDFQYEFTEVTAEHYSDTEIQLEITYDLLCRNNSGICYRAIPRIYVNDSPIGPTDQLNTASWIEKGAKITDKLIFVLPAAQSYLLELSRDGSNWKRGFRVLSK
ncbi:MAG: hypothetical protein IPN76_06455 [Saprospiraceae bacterium]|nr:hypothetical protein [Saprospiraceae bacterium]